MTLLDLILDGGIAAAELLALLFVTPASAREPVMVDAPRALEQRVQLHRLSATVDVRLLGSLADVRIAQAVSNDSLVTLDLARVLPVIDEHVDALRLVRNDDAVELLGTSFVDDQPVGHARLSTDERIADAVRLAPGDTAIIEAIATQPLVRAAGFYRATLPVQLEGDAPRAILLDEDVGLFLVLVPHRTASRATLVLRPVAGEVEILDLGAIDTRRAVLVPLASRDQLARIAQGAVELELTDDGASWWATVVPELGAGPAVVQTDRAN